MRPKELKRRAISLLRTNWAQAVVIILIYITAYLVLLIAEMSVYYYLQYQGLVEAESFFMNEPQSPLFWVGLGRALLGLLFVLPIHIGAKWWFLHAARGEINSVDGVLVCYGNLKIFFKTLWMRLSVGLLLLIPSLPLFGCVYGVFRVLEYISSSEGEQGFLIIMAFLAGLLFICLGVLYLIYCMNFALTDYLFCLNPDISVTEAIRLSVSMMREHRRDMIQVVLSYIPWIPVAMLIFPLLFLIPYFAMTFTVAVNQIIEGGEASDQIRCPAKKPRPAR